MEDTAETERARTHTHTHATVSLLTSILKARVAAQSERERLDPVGPLLFEREDGGWEEKFTQLSGRVWKLRTATLRSDMVTAR